MLRLLQILRSRGHCDKCQNVQNTGFSNTVCSPERPLEAS